MEYWLLGLAGGAVVLMLSHGVVVLVYSRVRLHGPASAVRRRLETYVAGER